MEPWWAPHRCLLVSLPAGPCAGYRAHSLRDIHYNDCQGAANTETSGYHETLTRFGIGVVVRFLEEANLGQSELDVVNQLIEAYAGRSGLWRDYYSFDLIQSVEARRKWIETDR